MSTKYLGTCIVCLGSFKVRKGLLVHHGYQRPGYGYIVGGCFGVGGQPHEKSKELAERFLKFIISKKEESVVLIDKLENNTVDSIYTLGKIYSKSELNPLVWKQKLEQHIIDKKYELEMLEKEDARLSRAILNWKEAKLKEWDEIQEEINKEKEKRRLEKIEKKQEKLKIKIKSIQRRLDSAYKKKKIDSFSYLWQDIPYAVRNIISMDRQKTFALIERDEMFKDIGLLNDGLYLEDRQLSYKKITEKFS